MMLYKSVFVFSLFKITQVMLISMDFQNACLCSMFINSDVIQALIPTRTFRFILLHVYYRRANHINQKCKANVNIISTEFCNISTHLLI